MKKLFAYFMALIACLTLFAGCNITGAELTENTAKDEATEPAAATEAAMSATEFSTEGEETPMETIQAIITMESGDTITLELYPSIAPITVENFVNLCEEGFYDGLTFHRIIAGFMIQGGDPRGNGTGGPGYQIKGEFRANGVENDLEHTRGVISMARSQAYDSAGSQFFIMHEDAPHLDGQYAAFGKVTEGIETVDAIAAVETDYYDAPLSPVVIESIKIVK